MNLNNQGEGSSRMIYPLDGMPRMNRLNHPQEQMRGMIRGVQLEGFIVGGCEVEDGQSTEDGRGVGKFCRPGDDMTRLKHAQKAIKAIKP